MIRKLFFALSASQVLGSLQILHPKDLKKELGESGLVRSSLGNFGHIQYGSSIVSDSIINDFVAWPRILSIRK